MEDRVEGHPSEKEASGNEEYPAAKERQSALEERAAFFAARATRTERDWDACTGRHSRILSSRRWIVRRRISSAPPTLEHDNPRCPIHTLLRALVQRTKDRRTPICAVSMFKGLRSGRGVAESSNF